MTTFLYGRVSTTDQKAKTQEEALKAAYPEGVYREEKKSGTTLKGRDVLNLILEMMEANDKLVVWKLDRLARNMNDLSNIVELIKSKGASLEILTQKIDTSVSSGRAFLNMLGVFAEFETDLRKERQMAGIIKAKAEGTHMGRPSSITDKQKAEIIAKSKDMNPTQLAKEYGVSRATIYNTLKEKA